jgi:hypothetical protein
MRARGICLAFLVLASSRAAGAAPCPVTAVLDGDAALVEPIDAELVRRGIATTPSESCPVAKAHVERRDDRAAITVTVVDPSGRRSERTLADPDAAAALIESWARQDMNAAALLGWLEPEVPAPEAERQIDIGAPNVRASTHPSRTRDPVTLSASAESARAFNATTYIGGRVSACGQIGPVCAGVTGRILAGDSRTTYDALVTIDAPFEVASRTVVLVGAGAGPGWFHAPRSVNETMTAMTTLGARIDGHAAISYALGRYVAVHAGISIGYSPQAPLALDPTGDSTKTNGEPTGFVRGDFGLRVGAP